MRESFDGGKASLFLDIRISGSHPGTVPLFLFRTAQRQKENFVRSLPAFLRGPGGNEQKRGAFFVVAGQIEEIRFLQKDVRRGGVLAAGVTKKQHRRIKLRDARGAAVGGDATGLALPGGWG